MSKSRIILFRGTEEEYKMLEKQALERNITPSALIRERVFGSTSVIQQSNVLQSPIETVIHEEMDSAIRRLPRYRREVKPGELLRDK